MFYIVTPLEIRNVSNDLFNFYGMISKELIMLIVHELLTTVVKVKKYNKS